MIDNLGSKPVCVTLAPASFVVTSAANVNTNIQPLSGEPGIEITMPASQVAAHNAAMKASFRRPIAAVADGQIIYLMTIEPNAADYLPVGSALIIFASGSEIPRIKDELAM